MLGTAFVSEYNSKSPEQKKAIEELLKMVGPSDFALVKNQHSCEPGPWFEDGFMERFFDAFGSLPEGLCVFAGMSGCDTSALVALIRCSQKFKTSVSIRFKYDGTIECMLFNGRNRTQIPLDRTDVSHAVDAVKACSPDFVAVSGLHHMPLSGAFSPSYEQGYAMLADIAHSCKCTVAAGYEYDDADSFSTSDPKRRRMLVMNSCFFADAHPFDGKVKMHIIKSPSHVNGFFPE